MDIRVYKYIFYIPIDHQQQNRRKKTVAKIDQIRYGKIRKGAL